jgi:hypothetical protein
MSDSELQTLNWQQVNTVLTGGDVDENQRTPSLDLAKQWYINRMTDTELTERMTTLGWGVDIDESQRLSQFKLAISEGRGSDITCIEPTDNRVVLNEEELILFNEDELTGWTGCSGEEGSLTFGPNNIINEEYNEWSTEYLSELEDETLDEEDEEDEEDGEDEEDETLEEDEESISYGSLTQGVLGSELMPLNRQFEDCVNNLLNEYDDYNDTTVIEEIHDISDISGLEQRHLLFIKRKLELMLLPTSRLSIKNCIIQYINIDRDVCSLGLADKMLTILNILFSVIGFNLNLHDVDNTDMLYRNKLIEIIDTLGDLIPRSLRKIIDISEEIELDECQGITNRTMVLRELYERVFTPGTNTINLDLGISDMISEENMNNTEFNRSAILAGLGLAFLKFI